MTTIATSKRTFFAAINLLYLLFFLVWNNLISFVNIKNLSNETTVAEGCCVWSGSKRRQIVPPWLACLCSLDSRPPMKFLTKTPRSSQASSPVHLLPVNKQNQWHQKRLWEIIGCRHVDPQKFSASTSLSFHSVKFDEKYFFEFADLIRHR